MLHKTGIFNPMQEHVGDAQHVGQLLFLHRPQACLHRLFIGNRFHRVITHVPNRTGKEAACTY